MKYFTDKELTYSATAERLHIPNYPDDQEIWNNLHTLVEKILDPARETLNAPIYVNCAYRSPQVNIAVNGAKNSQHIRGQAADIRATDMKKLLSILKKLDFDQLGIYPNFYHVSFDPNKTHQRHQIFYSN